MNQTITKWVLFIVLSIIWGSSFILMKLGINGGFSAYQVAAIRMLSAAIFLLPFAYRAFKNIPPIHRKYAIASGLLGSFFPAFLYCIAETRIDSSLAGILNALTPLFTIVVGSLFFKMPTNRVKIIGVVVGLVGLILLPFAGGKAVSLTDIGYSLLVILATLFYGINVNVVSRYLKAFSPIHVVSLSFSFILIPAAVILFSTGFFNLDFSKPEYTNALLASTTLGIGGTAIAGILFYQLLKMAGPLFGSLVTYGMPFIAVGWGIYFHESVNMMQIGCLAIILAGVYIVNQGKS